MIDKQLLTQTVEDAIKDTSIFIVDITISKDNSIVVELDSDDNMDIDMCTSISRKIESVFNDYRISCRVTCIVGSAGLTSPFKVKRQWQKNIGNEIEVLTKDGRKLTGILVGVNDENFIIQYPVKMKEEGKKKPVIVSHDEPIAYDNCKKACYLIKF